MCDVNDVSGVFDVSGVCECGVCDVSDVCDMCDISGVCECDVCVM